MPSDPVAIQRSYYASAANTYDDLNELHNEKDEFALSYMIAMADHLEVESILDIGSGTGRALRKIKAKMPNVRAVGIEPSPEMRNVGHGKGLSELELIDGDAMRLTYADRSFDLVCEYSALHHIPQPAMAVAEMLRVARKAVFISDLNDFGQGVTLSRFLKQLINDLGAWRIAKYFITKGRGYKINEGDGVYYSYSLFNEYKQIAEQCRSVHMLNTANATPNLYRSASHVALLGIKK
jgi:ubiquinone/menaquinone biosynthesis C-methylase UbiE